jgi:superfamily II DNA or RNA helicase
MKGLFDQTKWKSLRPLRPRQAAAIESIRKAIREGHKRIIVQAPTGFGKTLLAAHLIEASVQKGKRPLFTCPAITLVDQTLKSFEDEGISDIGVIQANHERTDWGAQVQIASVQTLIRRPLPEVDMVIVDEAHLGFEKLNERMDSDEWRDKYVIGLTATPWAKGMGLRWTKLIIAATVSELIEESHLSPFVIFAPMAEADFSKLKVQNGEFTEASSSAIMGEKRIVADVVATWQERCDGMPTFLFAVDRNHAKSLRDEFESLGVGCGYIDANTSREYREKEFGDFRRGRNKIIASVGCLTTGVDEDVRCIIDASPTRSEIRHVQKIGRGLRTAPGKEVLTILDHAGNTLRLGMVTDILHDRLDRRTKQEKGEAYEEDKKPAKPRKCDRCNALIPANHRQCPACGAMVFASTTVETVPGQLVEFTGKKKKKDPALAFSMFEKQEWYSGFLTLAHQRNRSEGWAAHRYKEKFGVWPNQLKKERGPTNYDIEMFDRHCRIKFAKSKAKEESAVASAG